MGMDVLTLMTTLQVVGTLLHMLVEAGGHTAKRRTLEIPDMKPMKRDEGGIWMAQESGAGGVEGWERIITETTKTDLRLPPVAKTVIIGLLWTEEVTRPEQPEMKKTTEECRIKIVKRLQQPELGLVRLENMGVVKVPTLALKEVKRKMIFTMQRKTTNENIGMSPHSSVVMCRVLI